jgi:5-methylcytosine-specific restriction endonuclease McrA
MTENFYESREWLDLRYLVLKKTNGACQLCGHRGSKENPIHVDHIKPRSKYPHLALVESNLQVLCGACNGGKSNKDETDWRLKPSKQFLIAQSASDADRAKLQQLAYLKVSGDPQIKAAALKESAEIWKRIEADWHAKGRPS